MTIGEKIDKFCNDIKLESTEDFDSSIKEITKKLNKKYYDSDSDEEHSYIVGSIGRKTAIKDVSDVDLIFNLPKEVYKRFDAYESNGQSSLLQEIKGAIAERYPTTDISADGQVVVISFLKYTIELVPSFLQDDDSFLYPDTNDGGSWKVTKPFQEQEESVKIDDDYNGVFVKLSNALRCWKDNIGFKFGGLLIDTLVYNFLKQNENYKSISTEDYPEIIEKQFLFLKNQNKEQSYWLALGSNQQVYNTDNGKFIRKANKAFNKIKNCENEGELEDIYIELFGTKFSKAIANKKISEDCKFAIRYSNTIDSEEFIEQRYPVDIRYNLMIECEVTQSGFRPKLLADLLNEFGILKPEKKLEFYILHCEVMKPYEVFWKIRNCGEEAYRRNDVRGQITKDDGTRKHIEHTKFRGNHYAECYIIKNGICVARDRIDIPITN